VLLAGKSISEARIAGAAGAASKGKGGATRRERKPWWKPASREQAASWATAAGIAVVAAVFFTTYTFSSGYGGHYGGTETLPLQRFTSNMGGMAGSGRYVYVSFDLAAAAGRRRMASNYISSFRITSGTALSDVGSIAVALTVTATGTPAEFEGDPIAILNRGSALVLVTRNYDAQQYSGGSLTSASVQHCSDCRSPPHAVHSPL
jgi:hypothetical protein